MFDERLVRSVAHFRSEHSDNCAEGVARDVVRVRDATDMIENFLRLRCGVVLAVRLDRIIKIVSRPHGGTPQSSARVEV